MRKRWILGFVGLGVAGWAAVPPDKLILSDDCSVDGASSLYPALYGRSFWDGQLKAIGEQRRRVMAEEQARQQIEQREHEIVQKASRVFRPLFSAI